MPSRKWPGATTKHLPSSSIRTRFAELRRHEVGARLAVPSQEKSILTSVTVEAGLDQAVSGRARQWPEGPPCHRLCLRNLVHQGKRVREGQGAIAWLQVTWSLSPTS